jgi:excisionase family DNA binding protein
MNEANRVISHTNKSTPMNAGDEELASSAIFEPYVSTDEIASFIGESRRNVLRMVREGKLTCYPLSGSKRHTYKFKRSEVSKDLEKLRRPSGAASEHTAKTRDAQK